MSKIISYKGMLCELLEASSPYPAMMRILSAKDIEKAYQEGFSCIGFPNEIVKELSQQEYDSLIRSGKFPPSTNK